MSVDSSGVITLPGTADGTLTIIDPLEDLKQFDDVQVLDLEADAIPQAGNVDRALQGFLRKAAIEISNIKSTGQDDKSRDRQDELKAIAAHCWWIDLLSLEVTSLDDEGFREKRRHHREQKFFYLLLYLGLDRNLKQAEDPSLTVETPEDPVTGAPRFVPVVP